MKKLSLINKQFIDAARNNQLDELKSLLSQGADIHASDDGALRCSVVNDHLDIVKFLVKHGANIHANDNDSLRYSAYNGHFETVKFLISNGADIHANNDEALRESSRNGHHDVWKLLSSLIQEEKLLAAASDAIIILPQKNPSVDIEQKQQVKLKKYLHSKI